MRIRVAGRGNFPARKNLSGTEERLLFNEYVLKNLENAAGREAEPDELEDQAAVSDGNKIYQEERKKVWIMKWNIFLQEKNQIKKILNRF